MRIFSLISLSLVLSGCGIFSFMRKPEPPEPEVQIVTKTIPLRIYQPPLPNEIRLENVKFFVITKDNLDEQISRVESILGDDFVVFALTPQSYENMAYNLQEIRRYVLQQKEIILYYREATKSEEGSTAQDWLRKNEDVVTDQQ